MRYRLVRLALAAAFLLTPAAVVSLALKAQLDATLAECVPTENDGVHYWNEIACFARAGFRGGYFVVNERPAAAGWSHFGPHGPGFPVAYGSLALAAGWGPASGPVFNLLVLAAGMAAWLGLARPDVRRLAVAIGLTAGFWPVLLYLPTTMQESLHAAVAFVLAGLAHRALDAAPGRRPGVLALPAVVLAASAVRLTWVLVLFPWLAVVLPRASGKGRLALVAFSAAAVLALGLFWQAACAPYPGFLAELSGLPPAEAAATLSQHAQEGFAEFVWSPSAAPLEIVQRGEVLAVALLGAGAALLSRRLDARPYGFAALNVALAAAVVVCLYDVRSWRDYRVLAPHLLLSLLVLVSGRGRGWVVAVAVVNVLFVGSFGTYFGFFHRSRTGDERAAVALLRRELAPYVDYRPGRDAWENTLLVCDLNVLSRVQPAPGVGVSYLVDHEGEKGWRPPLKSRFVLGKPPPEVRDAIGDAGLRFLTMTTAGPLYENPTPGGDGGE
jgi:hypothetical protein